MRSDPFKIEGPAVVSFSGGRTSGYMLWRILQANGGKLPENVFCTFANTGRERTETLDFVQAATNSWGVPCHWLEANADGKGFFYASYVSAARDGEPFTALTRRKKYLPNMVARFCTADLKVKPIIAFMASKGFEHFTNIVGIRADEPRRVARMRSKEEPWCDYALPLADAGIEKPEVMQFWSDKPYNLKLMPHESNCDLCFLKGGDIKRDIIRRHPHLAQWWIDREAEIKAKFRADQADYATLLRMTQQQPTLFDVDALDDSDTRIECLCHD